MHILFWRRKEGSLRKVNRSLSSLSVREGLLVCRKWQMSLGCASSAGSSSMNSWCELCDCVNVPACCSGGEGRCSSSGFKINQSGMWPLGPKGFIHTEERTFCSLHLLVILTWLAPLPAHFCSFISRDDLPDVLKSLVCLKLLSSLTPEPFDGLEETPWIIARLASVRPPSWV